MTYAIIQDKTREQTYLISLKTGQKKPITAPQKRGKPPIKINQGFCCRHPRIYKISSNKTQYSLKSPKPSVINPQAYRIFSGSLMTLGASWQTENLDSSKAVN